MNDVLEKLGVKRTKAFVEATPEHEEQEENNPNNFYLAVTDATGHKRLIWDKRSPEQLKEAQEKFYELLDKGYSIFATQTDGKPTFKKLLRFDPNLEEVVYEEVEGNTPETAKKVEKKMPITKLGKAAAVAPQRAG